MMMRRTRNMLVVALLAAFTAALPAEAATKTTRHRPKHSSRVTSGVPAATGTTGTTGTTADTTDQGDVTFAGTSTLTPDALSHRYDRKAG